MQHTEAVVTTPGTDVLFFDDFVSRDLDRAKWNVRTTGHVVNDEQQAYIDSPETIYTAHDGQVAGEHNGVLIIHPHYRPGFVSLEGKRFDFVSGRIDTQGKFDFLHGTAAARIKLPRGVGVWPAFWLLGSGKWPACGEIDVVEYVGEPDWVNAAVHGPGYSGEGGLANNLYFSEMEDPAAWHVYSVDWQPDTLLFTVDGRVMYRVTRAMTDFFGPWVFDTSKHLILNLALGGIYPFKINGIRSPYYGLAEETVQMIKQDQVWLAVDWIKVLRTPATAASSPGTQHVGAFRGQLRR